MPSASPAHDAGLERVFFAVSVVLIFAWLAAVWRWVPDGIVDEPVHLATIGFLHAGKAGWPEEMPMTPGYHFLAVTAKNLLPPFRPGSQARLITVGMTLLGFAGFAALWRHVHGRPAGRAVLLLALLPLFQTYTTLAYTDVPALALALCATWAQFTGRRAFAALALIGAIAIRQTFLAWIGFFIVWEFLRPDAPRREFLRRCAWMLLLLGTAAAVVLVTGRVTLGTKPENHLRPNPGILHIAALLLLLFGLPVWFRRFPEGARQLLAAARVHPRATLGLIACALATIAVLTITYDNFHPWNRVLRWDVTRAGPTFSSLTSWPLVGMERHLSLRLVSSFNLVLMTSVLVLIILRQPRRLELCLVLCFGLSIALTNSLVEPRYLLPTAVFLLVFLEIPKAEWCMLVPWWGALVLAYAPFILNQYSLW